MLRSREGFPNCVTVHSLVAAALLVTDHWIHCVRSVARVVVLEVALRRLLLESVLRAPDHLSLGWCVGTSSAQDRSMLPVLVRVLALLLVQVLLLSSQCFVVACVGVVVHRSKTGGATNREEQTIPHTVVDSEGRFPCGLVYK